MGVAAEGMAWLDALCSLAARLPMAYSLRNGVVFQPASRGYRFREEQMMRQAKRAHGS
jgi:hypothetical protein